jgi:hypothetical protein
MRLFDGVYNAAGIDCDRPLAASPFTQRDCRLSKSAGKEALSNSRRPAAERDGHRLDMGLRHPNWNTRTEWIKMRSKLCGNIAGVRLRIFRVPTCVNQASNTAGRPVVEMTADT